MPDEQYSGDGFQIQGNQGAMGKKGIPVGGKDVTTG
jgi:hypothetical protein